MTKNPDACYAIIEIEENKKFKVEHHFVKYDNNFTANKIRERKFPKCEDLARMFER